MFEVTWLIMNKQNFACDSELHFHALICCQLVNAIGTDIHVYIYAFYVKFFVRGMKFRSQKKKEKGMHINLV